MFCSFGMTLTFHGLIAISLIKEGDVASTGMTHLIAINLIKEVVCPSGFTDGREFRIKVRLMLNGSPSVQSPASSSTFVGFSLSERLTDHR